MVREVSVGSALRHTASETEDWMLSVPVPGSKISADCSVVYLFNSGPILTVGTVRDLLLIDAELVPLRALDGLNLYALKDKELVEEAPAFLNFRNPFISSYSYIRLFSTVRTPDRGSRHVAM